MIWLNGYLGLCKMGDWNTPWLHDTRTLTLELSNTTTPASLALSILEKLLVDCPKSLMGISRSPIMRPHGAAWLEFQKKKAKRRTVRMTRMVNYYSLLL